jgi:membrane-associated phospholipid phosphatase
VITLGLAAIVMALSGSPPASDDPPQNNAVQQDARDQIYYPSDTEKPIPLGKKLIRNVLLDQKEIWTSPFHMHREDAKWWVGVAAVTGVLIATDHQSSKIFENSPGQVSWGNHVSNIGATYTLIPVVAGFYGAGALAGNSKARETGVLGGEALIDSLIVVEVLKSVTRRNRPDSGHDAGHFFDSGDSFPSGHSIASWALASVVAHEYSHKRWVPFVAYGLATVVSSARFVAQRHYASDVVAGGAMGWFIGRYVYQTHEDHGSHPHAWMHPIIAPHVEPSQGTYGMAVFIAL